MLALCVANLRNCDAHEVDYYSCKYWKKSVCSIDSQYTDFLYVQRLTVSIYRLCPVTSIRTDVQGPELIMSRMV